MNLAELRRKVKPATVEVDSTGCVEIIAPEGYCYEHTLHALVTDPAMLDPGMDVYVEAYSDFRANFSGHFQKCASTCSCKE